MALARHKIVIYFKRFPHKERVRQGSHSAQNKLKTVNSIIKVFSNPTGSVCGGSLLTTSRDTFYGC